MTEYLFNKQEVNTPQSFNNVNNKSVLNSLNNNEVSLSQDFRELYKRYEKLSLDISNAPTPERVRAIMYNPTTQSIALIHRVIEAKGQDYFSFPGGGIDKTDKDPYEATIREVSEELNLKKDDYIFLNKDRVVVGQGVYKRELLGQSFTYYAYLTITENNDVKVVGEECNRPADRGTYDAVWVKLEDVPQANIKDKYLKEIVISLFDLKAQN